MPENNPWQKLSIWYLWEHLLVPEHRIPISVILRLRLSVEHMVEDMEIVNISLYICITTNIDKNSYGSDSLNKSMRLFKNSMEILANC